MTRWASRTCARSASRRAERSNRASPTEETDMLDVFRSDAFSAVSLTASILKAPYKPGRIGGLKLFTEGGIRTNPAVVAEEAGALTLIATSPRGGQASA